MRPTIIGTDGELARDEMLFDENVARVVAALSGSGVPVDHAVSTLRVFAMNLSAVFSNLANDLETLVVHRRDSGQAAGRAGKGGV
ncbi:MAG TPA: hypothetical protein VHV55_01955 [Pirellulales bacterium]|nr:hypothetical protein [Pirellulales bacterium]